MKIKIIAIFIVLILLVFSIGFAIGITRREMNPLKVKAGSSVLYGKAPLSVTFTSTIFNLDGEIKKALWDFNDGTTSNQRNTSHTFDRNGIFNVTIKIWDKQGQKTSDSLEITVYNYYHPIAKATSNNTYGKSPLTIQFNATAFDIEDEKVTYLWDFDDGTTSDKQNPKHTFQKVGTYTVRLTVTDSDGLKDTDVIHVTAIDDYPPIAKASADTESGKIPLTVQFYGEGEDVDGSKVTYHWYFENTLLGKNDESTEKNPTHTFYSPGIYIVKLTVTDEDGSNDTDDIKIVVNERPIINSMLSGILNRIKTGPFFVKLWENLAKNVSALLLTKFLNNRIEKNIGI